MDRREFVTWSAGGALLLAMPAKGAEIATLSPWVRIGSDGRVTLVSTVSDMGQGSRTGQAQVLADELDADWASLTVDMAPDTEPFRRNGLLYTGGSHSIEHHYEILRRAGATVRAQLKGAAARSWGVPAERLTTEPGIVLDPVTKRKLGYGALAAEAATIPPLAEPPLKTPSERRYIGKPLSVRDQRSRVDGSAVYGLDVRRPGQRFAAIRQCPVFGGTLDGVDDAPALAAGALKVVRLKNAVAVIAPSTWTAFKAIRALEPRWTPPANPLGSGEIDALLDRSVGATDSVVRSTLEGDAKVRQAEVRAGIAAAPRRVEASYELPYIAHATMEPMNATAQVRGGRIEIWAPTQAQTDMRTALVDAIGCKPEDITINTTLLGGGFGRRLQPDYAVQAVQIAQAADGAPVQLVWTREEDFGHDFYRPSGRVTYRAGLAEDGLITHFELVGSTTNDVATGSGGPGAYAVTNYAVMQKQVDAGVPVGAWRSVDATITVFAKESFIDECALAGDEDPLAYRRRLVGPNARGRRVLDAVAEAIGYPGPRAPGRGIGLALFNGWDTTTAHAIEVAVEGDRIRVLRIVVAGDPGTVVNPQQVRAQWEGGALQALSVALGEKMTFTSGAADQANFHQYPLLRMSQAPDVKVLLFETPGAKVGGVGEPGTPGVPAALANAVFAATGKRVRALPFASQGFTV